MIKLQDKLLVLKEKEFQIRKSFLDTSQKLEVAKSSFQMSTNKNEVVKCLMEEKQNGLQGIYGPLGDLGTIDSKYDVAISSGFAEKLKMIVVENVKTAELCVRILKNRNLGRATFIVLERVGSYKKVETPENAPRLIDLVKPKQEKFKSAFYYVLRDTLIADNIDDANRLAFGKTRWKVITLDGKVIERSGTLSGGGNKISKGGMRQVFDNSKPEEIQSLDKEKNKYEEELRVLKQSISSSEEQVEELGLELENLSQRFSQIEVDVSTSEKQLDNLNQTKEMLKSKTIDQKKIEQIEREINKLKNEEIEIKNSTCGLHKEIKTLCDKILEVGGDKLRRHNNLIVDIRQQIAFLEEQNSNVIEQKSNCEMQAKKANQSVEKFKKESSAIEIELSDLEIESTEKLNTMKRLETERAEAKDVTVYLFI